MCNYSRKKIGIKSEMGKSATRYFKQQIHEGAEFQNRIVRRINRLGYRY